MNQPYQIYVHIPFCKARCGYCAFSSCTNYDLCEKYFDKLFDEIENTKVVQDKISTIFIGGGTPSSVPTKYVDLLFEKLRTKFDLSNVCEITVECNPESVTQQLLTCLKRNGVNRLSFGLQSVNDDTLKKIGRLHNYNHFLIALNLAIKNGFTNLNADLIVGLPENKKEFINSIKTIANLPLQHVSIYALELHENSPMVKACKTYNHTEDDLADMYDDAVEMLENNGYNRYEISNFAKAGQKCKHNLGYWQQRRYYGFGAAASSFVENTRKDNVFDVTDYINTPTEKLSKNVQNLTSDELANEYVMLGLRLEKGISLKSFSELFHKDFWTYFEKANALLSQGFLQIVGNNVFVPQEKFYVVNSILCELLQF